MVHLRPICEAVLSGSTLKMNANLNHAKNLCSSAYLLACRFEAQLRYISYHLQVANLRYAMLMHYVQ